MDKPMTFTLPAGTVCKRKGIPFVLQHATLIECAPEMWPEIQSQTESDALKDVSALRWSMATYVVPAKPSALRVRAAPRPALDPRPKGCSGSSNLFASGIVVVVLLGLAIARSVRKGVCD